MSLLNDAPNGLLRVPAMIMSSVCLVLWASAMSLCQPDIVA
jgi:hypothetical protein